MVGFLVVLLITGTSSNSYVNGSGDGKLGGIALYGTKHHDDGRYLDIIARGNRLSNDYKLYSIGGQRLNGDYHTYGILKR